MKSVHLVIPDLFLPKDIAAEACRGLYLPALEKMLGRGIAIPSNQPSAGSGPSTSSGRTDSLLENMLCELFGLPFQDDAPIAAISAAFDGLAAGYWLRADPAHLHLQRDRMLVADVRVRGEEASTLCVALNLHFAGQGMEFFAPHPQRWYVRLDTPIRILTTPLSQAIGGDVRGAWPTGEDASRWHQVFNEIQMLLHAHPLNEAREARGELPINSVWFWGGGDAVAPLQKNFHSVSSDDVLAEMFAAAASVSFSKWAAQWSIDDCSGKQLLVWTGLRSAMQQGDLTAWGKALQDFENSYAQPIWQALRAGKIARLQLDIPGGENLRRAQLTRGDTWAFWRRAKPLASYSMM
jgi:hypothetical protein